MPQIPKIPIRMFLQKAPKQANMFIFTIETPILRTQIRIPRKQLNSLRGLIEKILIEKWTFPQAVADLAFSPPYEKTD